MLPVVQRQKWVFIHKNVYCTVNNIILNLILILELIIFIGAIAAYSIGQLELNWFKVGDLFLGIGSLLAGIVLLGCFYTRTLWFIYAFYIIYGCLYQTMLTVAE